ncbi:Crp/Fnr family transcriptional regulator [Tychonema sp. LEGE 07199]|uniref:Crp/Fnr family transcriptional regulator n=1 Tax=unclassified Tychonema TaxID=2642144 RepID=UPI00187E25A8|nr:MULTISPECIES: Crp/Fnr family transcriptional regulator [unclassified Tychonema]MBE9121673.1 Crp/Fnr family transcriptional regulator [Tychonema sp. LEGE 07199]MBE9133762.1 Crp/Fnr family transcriptional regulator [Tychonema sp. LEGE 07196]
MTIASLSTKTFDETSRHIFSRRSHLPNRSNALWRIESGVVRTVTWLEDGTIITLGLWVPGDTIGKPISKCDPFQIECLTKVEAVLLSVERWLNRDILLNHIQQAEDFMIMRGYKKVDFMLYKLLTWLAKRFGSEVERGHLIDMILTHQDIAEILGTSRVTVTRTLGHFEQQGLIERLPLHRIILQPSDVWHYEI